VAKELHIKIDRQIGGLFIDSSGWLMPGYSAMEFEYALSEMPNPKRLIIHADSPGGDGWIAQKIYNRLQELKRKEGTEVHVINESVAFSAMTFIAMAASPGCLTAYESSLWSVHKPLIAPDEYMNADDLRKAANELDSFESVLISAYAARTGKSTKQIQDALREDILINSTEAKEQGWIDEIIPNKEPVKIEKEAKIMAFKPVAYFSNIKQIESEMITPEQEDSIAVKVFNSIKTFLNITPATETMPPAATTTEPVTPVAPAAEPDPKDTEIAQLKARIAELEPKEEELETTRTELETNKTEVVNLKTQLAAAKKAVPGGGDNTPAPAQNFKGDNTGTGGSPFSVGVKNLKSK